MESETDLKAPFDAAVAAIEFLSPAGRRGYRKPALERAYLDERIPHGEAGETLALRRWGTGKAVLLIHGWAGSQSDMHWFVPALLDAGFSAVTVDLPAHGDSSGTTASLDQLAAGVVKAANHLGHLSGIIAHSVGCAATTIATASGVLPDGIVLVAPPESYENAVNDFAEMKNFSEEEKLALHNKLKSSGIRTAIFASDYLRHLETPGLVVHSSDDEIIPSSTGKRVSEIWKNGKYLEVHGLGHRKILKDAKVIGAAVDFIATNSSRHHQNNQGSKVGESLC